jgi:ribosomal protein S18 acetylase RimI-like enzyme
MNFKFLPLLLFSLCFSFSLHSNPIFNEGKLGKRQILEILGDQSFIGSIIYEKENNIGIIYNVWVVEKYRGQGYGKILMEKALEDIKESCSIIKIDAFTPLVLFLKKFGFVIHPRKENNNGTVPMIFISTTI